MLRTLSFGMVSLLAAFSLACGDDGGGDTALPDVTSTVGRTSTPVAMPTQQATPSRTAGPAPTVGTASTTVQAELREFSITVDPTAAPSGTVTFEVRNRGTV